MKCSLSYRINRLNLIGLFAIRYNDYYKYQLPCFDKGKMGIVLVIQFIFLSERIELEVYD